MPAPKPKPGDEVKRGEGKAQPKNLHLSAEARRRLGLFSLETGKPEGAIVDWLICTNAQVRRFYVTDKGVAAPPCPDPDPAGGIENTAPTLPLGETLTPSPPNPGPPAPGKGRGGTAGGQTARGPS